VRGDIAVAVMPMDPTDQKQRKWWRGGVIYQAYPRSWRDSNGDGTGDLRGVISKLDYLEWLGIDGVWLNPIMPSPDHDWGYDVSDYQNIHPDMGTINDFDELTVKAARRGISVVVDLVPSHTSDQHPWFMSARSSRNSRYRDYYVWREPGRNRTPPNNWTGFFGLPAWSFDEATDEYYMHNFSPHQPQLNWWNAEVRSEFDRILSFWLEKGIGGVRVDAVQALLYDRGFRDNPPATSIDSAIERRIGQRFEFNANQIEAHDIVRRWRTLFRSFDPPRLLFGETWVPSIEEMARYYGDDDEFDLTWNLSFLQSRFAASPLRKVIERTLASLPDGAWAAWAMSTHDGEGRGASRWCHGRSDAIRCALVLLLTLRGTPILYYGDEIGMVAPLEKLAHSARRDKGPRRGGRDRSRTPMQWTSGPGAGFTDSSDPWLPIGDTAVANVEVQMGDRRSDLWLVRDLLTLRRNSPDLALGVQTFVPSLPGILAWRRGEAICVAVNLGTAPHRIRAVGRIAICTDRERDGERLAGWLELRPFEAAIVRETT
jgi:alpha-glucosidase